MSDDVRNELEEADHDESAAASDRDATVERLERAIAEERQHSAALRREAEELRFKMDILERSYSKQLEDARLRAEAAEQKAEERGVRIAELDGARGDAIELLTQTKIEIDRLNGERNQLRRQLASRDGWNVEAAGEDLKFDDGESTINALMNDAKWMAKAESEHQKQIRERRETEAAEEPAAEEMISPDLVLKRKGE